MRLSLDGVPEYISMDDIIATSTKITGVKGIHHIHIWAISTTENALTAHVVLQPGTDSDDEQRITNDLKPQLELRNIHHVTLETEKGDVDCETVNC